MSFLAKINRLPVAKPVGLKASIGGNKLVTVNSRSVVRGKQFDFKSSEETKDKMQLKELMLKAKTDDYKNNPIMARRLQQQIAQKASQLYGVDSKKMMGGTLQAISANNYGGGNKLNDKVNGRK